MKVLFIGNSFTFYNNIPSLFEKIASSTNKNVIVESVTKGGYTLEKFTNPSDEFGKKVDEKLNSSNDYEVIVLQEQSIRPLTKYKKIYFKCENFTNKNQQNTEKLSDLSLRDLGI